MNAIETTCKFCIFNKSINGKQYGCEFSFLERFGMHGNVDSIEERWINIRELLELEESLPEKEDWGVSDYNNKYVLAKFINNKFDYLIDKTPITSPDFSLERKYFLINRICRSCRDQKWADKTKLVSLDLLKEKVIEETKLKLTFVVFFNNDDLLSDLEACLESISKQTMAPLEIILVNNQNNFEASLIKKILANQKCEWRHHKILHKNYSPEFAFDDVLPQIHGQYYTLVNLPCNIPEDFVEKIHISLNQRMEKFVALEGDNLVTIQTLVTKSFDGNFPSKVEESDEFPTTGILNKLKKLNQPSLIKQLCQI